ncbi:unnamed protein product [Scytosiphon promiscuus]
MGTGEGPHDDGVHQIFVPGRLCVIGEHTDWAAGYRDQNRAIPPGFTLVATTREGLHARVGAREDGRLVFKAATCSSSAAASSLPTVSGLDDGDTAAPGGGGKTGAASASGGGAADACLTLDVAMTEEALEGVIEAKGFFMYVAGTALVVCSKFGLFSRPSSSSAGPEAADAADGVTIDNHLTTLPLKKGLSSSAAVCVLVVRALCLTYGLKLTVPQVMELAHLGEAHTGSKCGRMDQCCALGGNHVAAMFFDGEDVRIYEVAPPECGIYLVVADLNGSKDTIKMLASLNECFPHAQDGAQERVHRYVRDNTKLAWDAVSAIERGDAEELGRAMTAAQTSFDECAIPICPSEFSSPLLHKVMSDERVKALTWGIKGVGAQGDGSVQMLARGKQEQEDLTRVLKEMGMSCVLPVTVIRSTPHTAHDGDGGPPPAAAAAATTSNAEDIVAEPQRQSPEELSRARDPLSTSPPTPPQPPSPNSTPRRTLHPRRVKSAVIVAAGLSTRMFPASAVVKKELFPIVDHDGVCKPVILAIMEGLAESGIERFVVVVQEKDIAVFDDFFSMKAVEKHKHRLKPAQRAYCARIEALRPRITYAVQEQQEGFGHAVFCARHALLDGDNGHAGPEGASRTGSGSGGSTNGGIKAATPAPNSDKHCRGKDEVIHEANGGSNGCGVELDGSGGGGGWSGGEEEDSSFLLVLGDHLYRRGPGTTHACASQLVHAFLEHGQAGKPAIGLKVMGESSVSPYGVAAGECVAHPPPHIVERWHRASPATTPQATSAIQQTKTAPLDDASSSSAEKAAAVSRDRRPLPLGGRVYRLTKFAEKPTAEFARENLVTPGLGPADGEGGEGRHLVVFGQYILPVRRTFAILAEDIRQDRRERGEFQLTSVLDRMREQDDGMLGCVIHGDALDMGIPSPYVETMGAFAKPHHA